MRSLRPERILTGYPPQPEPPPLGTCRSVSFAPSKCQHLVSQCPDFSNVFRPVTPFFQPATLYTETTPISPVKKACLKWVWGSIPRCFAVPGVPVHRPAWLNAYRGVGALFNSEPILLKTTSIRLNFVKGPVLPSSQFFFETDSNFHFFFISLKGSPNLNSNQCTRTSLRSLPVCEPQCIHRFQVDQLLSLKGVFII